MRKYTKSLLALVVVTVTIMCGTTVNAEEKAENNTATTNLSSDENQAESGMTPDSLFYFLDRFSEKIQLLFTFDNQKEATLLLTFAEERLAESSKMVEKDKNQHVTDLIDAYLANLQEAEEKIADIAMNEETDQTVKEHLTKKLEDVTTIVTGPLVDAALPEEQKLVFIDKKQEAYLVANVINELNVEKVKELRQQGLGFGEIVKVITFAEEGDKTEAEIVAMLKDEKKDSVKLQKR